MRPNYRFDLKKCLTKLITILKLCIILLRNNYICLFDSQMQILNIIHSVGKSAVAAYSLTRWAATLVGLQRWLACNAA